MSITSEYTVQYWAQVEKEERDRRARYKKAWEYFRGDHEESLKRKIGKPDDNLVINLYKYIINRGVVFLFGKEIQFQLIEGADTDAEQRLAEIWEANDKMAFLADLALNGANCGHVFVEISPNAAGGIDLVNIDPAIIRPQWDAHDLKRVLWYKIEYPAVGPDGKMAMYKRMIERTPSETWTITRYIKPENRPTYQQDGPTIAWNYPFAPVVDWKNLPAPNEYFGAPDVDDLAAQDTVNFVASNIKRVIRYHGNPKTIGKGFQVKSVDVAPDEMIVLPTPDADVFNLEMASDLTASRAFLESIIDLFLQINNVPNMNPTKISVGSLSGFALKILYGDLLAQTEMKRRLYGRGLSDLNARLLVLLGISVSKMPKVEWQDPLPTNKSETIDELIKELDAQLVSKETAQKELGRDPLIEAERMQGEQAQNNSIGSAILRAFNAGQGGAING